MNPVVKILQTGETNINTTDIWRFAFHSEYPTLKIHQKGSTTSTIYTGNSAAATKTIVHNLGYKPNVFVYILKDSRLYEIYGQSYCGTIQDAYGNVSVVASVSFSNTNLYININTYAGWTTIANETFTIYYTIQLDEG